MGGRGGEGNVSPDEYRWRKVECDLRFLSLEDKGKKILALN